MILQVYVCFALQSVFFLFIFHCVSPVVVSLCRVFFFSIRISFVCRERVTEHMIKQYKKVFHVLASMNATCNPFKNLSVSFHWIKGRFFRIYQFVLLIKSNSNLMHAMNWSQKKKKKKIDCVQYLNLVASNHLVSLHILQPTKKKKQHCNK